METILHHFAPQVSEVETSQSVVIQFLRVVGLFPYMENPESCLP